MKLRENRSPSDIYFNPNKRMKKVNRDTLILDYLLANYHIYKDGFEVTSRDQLEELILSEDCETCNGEGGREDPALRDPLTAHGRVDLQAWSDCPDCEGTGRVPMEFDEKGGAW